MLRETGADLVMHRIQERKRWTADCEPGRPRTGEDLKKRDQPQRGPTIQRQQLEAGHPSRVGPA